MHILWAGEHKAMPWKNGQGSTTEIAIWPVDASLESFDWRVSMALVPVDGPFSSFPGINRTLAILEGAGLDLSVEGRETIRLKQTSDPHAFPADAPTSAALIDGPVIDLNVMARRGAFRHRMRRFAISGTVSLPVIGETTLLFCQTGNVAVESGEGIARLGTHDALLSTNAGANLICSAEVESILFVVEFQALTA